MSQKGRDMGDIHQLLLELGREGALKSSPIDRRAVEAAAGYLSTEEGDPGFVYSGWAQTALPHKRQPDDALWHVRNGRISLIIEPGAKSVPDGSAVRIGVPFGSRARLILIYLQSEALRTGSREVELGRSLRVWLGRLGIPIGGKSMAEVRDQAERISRCHMTFEVTNGKKISVTSDRLVTSALLREGDDGGRLVERVFLSQPFFDQLRRYPVQIDEAAVRQLANNSFALDVYCWLAYRLHALPNPTEVSWQALHTQFGSAYGRLRDFRTRFIPTLTLATAVYPEAKVEVNDNKGVILHPSPAPTPTAGRPRRLG